MSEAYSPETVHPFRVCENCGRLTPRPQAACVNCGAVSQQAAAEQQARAEHGFLQSLWARATPVNNALVVINIALYLLMTYVAGGDFWQTLLSGAGHGTLLAFGAQTAELIQSGEWFRLVTPAFLHIGLLHLGFNSYALWTIGPLVERLFGSARYLLIYLLAAIGGSLGSFLYHRYWQNEVISVGAGASGAIFGLFGVLAVFGYRYRHELPANFIRSIKASVLPVIVINLLIGFSLTFIDNAAHIGGLLTGGVLALVVPYLATDRQRRVSAFGLGLLGVCIAVIIVCFAQAYQHSGPYLKQGGGQVKLFLENFTSANETLVNTLRSEGSGRANAGEVARLTAAQQALAETVAPDARSEQLRDDLLRLLERQRQVSERTGDAGAASVRVEELREINRAFREWIRTEGRKYGYQLTDEADDKAN